MSAHRVLLVRSGGYLAGMTHRLCIATLSIVLAACLAGGQDDPVNLIHDRHKHHHNEPHPTVVDDQRFVTDRDSPVVLPLPAEKDAFTFVVYGDRTGGPDDGVNILADAVRDTNLLEPDLVMTVGDLINGYNESPRWMEQMREFKGIMDELLCPWFPVAGNHDVYWRGPQGLKPEGEHDANYEMHFGPLWYAFEHKNSWFVALYTDEGNPETGEKNFSKPESQQMSPEQFEWLDATLTKAAGADHVFIFLHHPRWLKGGYGNDWDSVHDRLVEAGNVSAVFAGHIHRMRHDGPFNGIEYVTLATVGGGQSGLSPDAGYLHHFNVITVRKDQIAMASLPVGEVQDVRALTGELSDEVGRLARGGVVIDSELELLADGSAEGAFTLTLRNPTTRPVEASIEPASADSRWRFTPDHAHATLEPGSEQTLAVSARRMGNASASTIDDALRLPEAVVNLDYLAEDFRYAVPERRVAVPVRVQLDPPAQPATERALRTGGESVATVGAEQIKLPQGPFTLECWMRADSFGRRVGLVAKTENSEYGFFVSGGTPSFSAHIGGRYVEPESATKLEPGRWYHLAGVYDGSAVKLYVDGVEVGSVSRTGERTVNEFPLVIGGDVDGNGQPTSAFDGVIDEVRLSAGAVYSSQFEPQRRLERTDSTVLLLHMDGAQGPYLFDSSSNGAHATMQGGAAIVEP